MKILITDDEPLARKRLRHLIEDIGALTVVGEAGNGGECLDLCNRACPDVVLMDIRMPGMDGLEAAAHLGALEKPPAVIFTTAYGDHALAAFETHAIDYLLKPISPEALFESVARGVVRVRKERRQRALYEQLERMLTQMLQIEEMGQGKGKSDFVPTVVELPNGVILDLGRRRLRYQGRDIHLSPSESRLLQVLLMHRGEVMSHQALVDAVHGYQVNEWEAPEIMRPIVSRLRRKLADLPKGRQWIVNVRGVGYMLDWEMVMGEEKAREEADETPESP